MGGIICENGVQKVIKDMPFQYNDGGRNLAGYKGLAGDCVVRAISIFLDKPYQEVYDELNQIIKSKKQTKNIKNSSSRGGIPKVIYHNYLLSKNVKWTPTMLIGSGCKVHLAQDELPKGRIIARVSKHLVAVLDGVINDTYNPSRGGDRCVYGYYHL